MTENHLTRQEIIEAARAQEITSNVHVADCADCRELVSLFRSFVVAGVKHFPEPPIGWVERAIAIGAGIVAVGKLRSFLAKVVFDSWAMPQPIGVRGESVESDRRLRFETESVMLDLRAEKQTRGWAFVAQVKGPAGCSVQIEADKKKLLPDSVGLYQWSGSRPPRKITLRSDEFVIELPELSWKKPQAN